MKTPTIECAHNCKEFCTALETAMQREKDAILQYGALRDQCDYPDVKILLNELILQRQRSIGLLVETKTLIRSKFEVLDQVREGFDIS